LLAVGDPVVCTAGAGLFLLLHPASDADTAEARMAHDAIACQHLGDAFMVGRL
jgi:hypothetical protein